MKTLTILAVAIALVLTGCAGMAEGSSRNVFCTSGLPDGYDALWQDAAQEWNDRADTSLSVDSDPACLRGAASEPARFFVVSAKYEPANPNAALTTVQAGGLPNIVVMNSAMIGGLPMARITALHEIGHSLGLHHSAEYDSVMWPSTNWDYPHLTDRDLANYRSISGRNNIDQPVGGE